MTYKKFSIMKEVDVYSNNLRSIVLIAAMVAISGCATTGNPGCGLLSRNGEMTVQKGGDTSGSSFCNVHLTYNNTSGNTVKPQIRAIFYDENGNTIAEGYQSFANIDPGRSQKITELVRCNGQSIRKMHIKEAVDYNTCDKHGCFRICGVYGREYTWNQ